MPRLDEEGGGGEKFFSPTKDIGTREGDHLGKGMHFPSPNNEIKTDRVCTVYTHSVGLGCVLCGHTLCRIREMAI